MDGCARSLLQSFNFVDRQGADLVFSLRFGRIATFSNSINRTQGKSTLRFLAPSIISTEARGVAAGAGFGRGIRHRTKPARRPGVSLRLFAFHRARLRNLLSTVTAQEDALVDSGCLRIVLIHRVPHYELQFAFGGGESELFCLLRRD